MDESQMLEFQQEMNKLMLDFSSKASQLAREFTQKTLEADKHSKFRVKRIVQTPREEEVMACLLAGIPYKGISDQLHISRSTVKYYVSKFLKRSGLTSRKDLEKVY